MYTQYMKGRITIFEHDENVAPETDFNNNVVDKMLPEEEVYEIVDGSTGKVLGWHLLNRY